MYLELETLETHPTLHHGQEPLLSSESPFPNSFLRPPVESWSVVSISHQQKHNLLFLTFIYL
jgi:hypothetical protein